jgi:hypothetical protein
MQTGPVVFEPGVIAGANASAIMLGSTAAGLVIVWALWRRWSRAWAMVVAAQRAEAASAEAPLAVGAATVIGVVKTDDRKAAIVLRIEQSGTEQKYGDGWTHEWGEISRTIAARTFVLRTKSGVAVTVEPGATPLVIEEVRERKRPSDTERVCEARIEHGATVRVSGQLIGPGEARRGPYRGGVSGWVLVPPDGGSMLVSAKPLADAQRPGEQAAFTPLAVAIALLVLVQLVLGYDYYPLALWGTAGTAEVVRLDTHVTRDDDRNRTHYDASFEVDGGGTTIDADLAYEDWARLHRGDHVPVVMLPGRHTATLGDTPTISLWRLVPLAFLTFMGAIALAGTRGGTARSDQRPFVTSGRGRLKGSGRGDESG